MNWLPRPNAAVMGHFFRSLAGNNGYSLLALYVFTWTIAAWARWRTRAQGEQWISAWRYDFLLIWLLFFGT